MRTCVIFNPTAKGDKARKFRRHLDAFGTQGVLKLTSCAGDARRLASEAVREDFEIVVAAGGDGTINEVLNGITDVPDGCERICLGVLPLGTVNVFARELAIPTRIDQAWNTILNGRETRIDLPAADYTVDGRKERRYFAQLAGAGLDARAIELVHWDLKKKIGPLAYVLAGLNALGARGAPITVSGGDCSATGQLVLIGNGRLYGGHFHVFPGADLRDGLLEVCTFPRVNWLTLARCGPNLLLSGTVPSSATKVFQAPTLSLTSTERVPFEVDGELVGQLPASFSVRHGGLRVIVP